jgi:AraC-like DNA-binding protein
VDLDSELRTVEDTLQVSICFHDLDGRLEALVGPQRIQHRTRFCVAAKRHSAGACTACDAYFCQEQVADGSGAFWKQCHAGLLECYVPIRDGRNLTASAFIGQWRWTGLGLPTLVRRDPQPPQPPPTAPSTPTLDDPEQLDRLLVFATMIGTRIETALRVAPSAVMPQRGDAIRAFLAHRASSAIDLGDLAKHLALSPTRTGHLVRETCGDTFPRLLLNARLAKARNLLGLTTLSVAAIAKRCGFRDRRYFHRCFKQAEGMTPEAWRVQRSRA